KKKASNAAAHDKIIGINLHIFNKIKMLDPQKGELTKWAITAKNPIYGVATRPGCARHISARFHHKEPC
ncbi:MAG: hypothetical protein QGH25_13080, partial [Candidatus Latescibacteria bacterium]|nr:hypothetical protein [Candidatus Latescibacterota bacterium]